MSYTLLRTHVVISNIINIVIYTYLVIIIRLPTEKNMQNLRALNSRNGIYIEDMRKHDKPEPKQTAKQINL